MHGIPLWLDPVGLHNSGYQSPGGSLTIKTDKLMQMFQSSFLSSLLFSCISQSQLARQARQPIRFTFSSARESIDRAFQSNIPRTIRNVGAPVKASFCTCLPYVDSRGGGNCSSNLNRPWCYVQYSKVEHLVLCTEQQGTAPGVMYSDISLWQCGDLEKGPTGGWRSYSACEGRGGREVPLSPGPGQLTCCFIISGLHCQALVIQ